MTQMTTLTPAQIAKATLRRLAESRLEPTPDNYARAWAEEAGTPQAPTVLPAGARQLIDTLAESALGEAGQRTQLRSAVKAGQWSEAAAICAKGVRSDSADGDGWSRLIGQLVRGLERGGKQWTSARKKDSLHRVLDSSRSDAQRLHHRLAQLATAWDQDRAEADDAGEAAQGVESAAEAASDAAHGAAPAGALADTALAASDAAPGVPAAGAPPVKLADGAAPHADWMSVLRPLTDSVRAGLPTEAEHAGQLADELGVVAERLSAHGPQGDTVQTLVEVCDRARRLFGHRHELMAQLHRLSQELAGSIGELVEDDSWTAGQCAALEARLGETLSARAVRAASDLLGQTRLRQRDLRQERDSARDALRGLIHSMLNELGELDRETGRFSEDVQRHVASIQQADTLEGLADVVQDLLKDSRTVHGVVTEARQRLGEEHQRATVLETRVRDLESELRRISDEASTDALTQIANRRGLMTAFDAERARVEREATELAVGLLDIDNFKKLNDTLGHAAGDQALVMLANHVKGSLRPLDVVARYGGEEFVVLLPGLPVQEAQQVLTRLQRALTASLFMHEGRERLVTFSAGVTAYRAGEAVDQALERADEALYEAKRTGKNKTCIG